MEWWNYLYLNEGKNWTRFLTAAVLTPLFPGFATLVRESVDFSADGGIYYE